MDVIPQVLIVKSFVGCGEFLQIAMTLAQIGMRKENKMSHFSEFTTNMNDEEALVGALEAMGFRGKIEKHQIAQPLYGYQGDVRPQKAHIIIRRKYVGSASNDIGFEKQADGTYKAHISDYDKNKYNQKWLDTLQTKYTGTRILNKVNKLKKYQVSVKEEGSSMEITLKSWS